MQHLADPYCLGYLDDWTTVGIGKRNAHGAEDGRDPLLLLLLLLLRDFDGPRRCYPSLVPWTGCRRGSADDTEEDDASEEAAAASADDPN